MRWNEFGEHPGDGCRNDDAGGHEGGAEDLHRGQDRDRQDEHQQGVDAGGVQAGGLGDLGVERREQQWAIGEEHNSGDEHSDDEDRHDVEVVDAEDAAEQGGVEAVAAPPEDGEEGQAEGERGGRDHADRGIGADRAAPS